MGQSLSSCFWSCNCPEMSTYEIEYNNVDITAYDTSDFGYSPVEDSVYKNAFGLGVLVSSTQNKIGMVQIGSFGFSNAMACDCMGSEYRYPDPIDNAVIYMTNIESGIEQEVTEFFEISGYDGVPIALETFFMNRYDGHDGFQFKLAQYDEVPNSVIFRVEISLESGTVFSDETDQINFYH